MWLREYKGLEIDLSYEHKTRCPNCAIEGHDNAGDNLHVYGLDKDTQLPKGAFCFACSWKISSFTENTEKQRKTNNALTVLTNGFKKEKNVGKPFNRESYDLIKDKTIKGVDGFRGVRKDISNFFGCRYEVNEDEEVKAVYYPTYDPKTDKICGYKIRKIPKTFMTPYGEVGKDVQMFGQAQFKTFNKWCLVVGGEEDVKAAYQMLYDNVKDKRYSAPAVVSSTVGESGACKQIQAQYAFFSRFEKIILCMDNDEAGRKATEAIVKCLPRGKVFIMNMRYKDPNSYIWNNETKERVYHEKEFIEDFWNHKQYTPAGVYGSSALYDKVSSMPDFRQLSLPPFLNRLSSMFNGSGFVAGEITTIAAKTSVGKTTIVNSLTDWWIENDKDEMIGVLSLEATAEKYTLKLLSHKLKHNLLKFKKDEREAYLKQPHIDTIVRNYLIGEDNSDRFYVCDDRGASLEVMQDKILEMIIQVGCTVIILDPYSDLLSGLSNTEQEEFVTWMKRICKEYDVSIICIAHMRKRPPKVNKDGKTVSQPEDTEDDIQGTSFLIKASCQTIILDRDKMAEDPIERNRTYVRVHKNRDLEETGDAGSFIFDNKTTNLISYEEYVEKYL